jgi:hypothetical protein
MALIVANDVYEQAGLRDLAAPAADADALARVLADPQVGSFAVQVLRNEPAHVIQARVEDLLADSRPADVVVLHFSCHGLKSQEGELFFAAPNTRPDRLASTAVPAAFVDRCMRSSRSRCVVLLLDCCYGGAFPRGFMARAGGDADVLGAFSRDRAGGRGRAVITASGSMEYAFEGDQLAHGRRQPSVFTAALVEGLETGDADQDEDGWISLDELYAYVLDKVQERSPHQTPSRQFDLAGELYLARSGRRRVRPAAIPAELHAALASDSMYARLGAVAELRSRLRSADLAVAAGAAQALAEVARTDIQYVAEQASTALAEAAIRPDPAELRLGPAPQGAPVIRQRVRLPGLPIAGACTPRASDGWIHVAQSGDGLEVSAGTDQAGTRYGSITLTGPTGGAVIPVTVEITAAGPASGPDLAGPGEQPGGTAPSAPTEAAARRHQATLPDMLERSEMAAVARKAGALSWKRTRTGAILALLAGVAGAAGLACMDAGRTTADVLVYSELRFAALTVAAAAVLLAGTRRGPERAAFLQGMTWTLVPLLPAALAEWLSGELDVQSRRVLAGEALTLACGALATAAVIGLVAGLRPAAARRHGFPLREPVAVALATCAIAAPILNDLMLLLSVTGEFYDWLDAGGILLGAGVSWYALGLARRRLGGALLIGLAAASIVNLAGELAAGTAQGVARGLAELAFLAAAMLLAWVYARAAGPEPGGDAPFQHASGTGG